MKLLLICIISLSLFANEKDFSNIAYKEYEKKNYNKAIEFYLKDSKLSKEKAEQAYYKIGFIYNKKLKDYSNAFKYFKMSSDYYNVDSFKELGLLYTHGKGIKKDYYEAFYHWLMAYELIKLNPISQKTDLQWLKDNLNALYIQNKNLIQKNVSKQYIWDTFFLGYMWDICIEGSPGKTKETKNMKFCDTATAQQHFYNSSNKSQWAKYKFWEIKQRYAGLYKPSNKGEKENVLEDRVKFLKSRTSVLNAYNELTENGFPLANIALAMNYIKGDITEKDLKKAKKYLSKAYNANILQLSIDIWIKYNLEKI